jgi:peptidyl-prolyl cis-trans isomerase B (cyclophilin B)
VEGMDVVDTLNKGEPPRSPDKIVKATVGAA